MIYYFREGNIETATTEIELQGWQMFTAEQTEAYLANPNLLPYKNGEFYELIDHNPPVVNIESFKLMKLSDMSNLSLMLKDEKYPFYKYQNAMSSLNMILRGQEPIYSKKESENIIELFDTKFKMFRDEYYRLKACIEVATTPEEIDLICFNNQFDKL
jgi:hypothetical protein